MKLSKLCEEIHQASVEKKKRKSLSPSGNNNQVQYYQEGLQNAN